jgi:hypothetical protein
MHFQIQESAEFGESGLYFAENASSITIPRNEWIDDEKVIGIFGKQVPLSFYYLHLKFNDPDSKYYQILPKELNSPLMWSKESIEYQLLETSGMLVQVEQKRKSLEKYFNACFAELIDWFPSVTFNDFLFADQLVKSRSMELVDGNVVVVPWIDAANHSPSPNAAWKVTEEGMELFLIKEIDTKTQEVLISYGAEKGNQSLFFGYHFTLNNNPVKQLLFPVVAWEDENPTTITLKRNLLKTWGMTEKFEIIDDVLTPESVTVMLLSMSPKIDEFATRTNLSPEDLVNWLVSISLHEVTLLRGIYILQEQMANLLGGCKQELDDEIELTSNIKTLLNLRETNVRDINTFMPIVEQKIEKLAGLSVVQDFLSSQK